MIEVTIRKTSIEWNKIESLIQKKYENRNLSFNGGKGYNHFLHAQIEKLFQEIEIGNCVGVKNSRKRKDFSLDLPKKTETKIRCLANKLGIEPGTLIARMVLDPHLLDFSEY